jgi:arylsulfatase A-like enzyme
MFLASMSLAQSLAQQSRPNIVFILIDDLRWDELEITGHPHEARTGAVVGQELT